MSLTLKDPLIKGHPIHAMLSDLPIGALAIGVACDVIGLASGKPVWRASARAAHTGALLSGVGAALVGLWDFQAVPREHEARRVGALHGYLNASVLTMLLGSLLLRRESQDPADGRPHMGALALAAAAFTTLTVSGWLGGELVFHLGWRVIPAEHAEQLEAALRERDETGLIEQAHESVQQYERAHALIP